MNVKKFSDAMSEIDSRYIDEALSYNEKPNRSRHTHRVSVVMAAALLAMFLIGCAVVAADMFVHNFWIFLHHRMNRVLIWSLQLRKCQ